jgi:hypothetical protein
LFANPTYLLNDQGDVVFSSWLIDSSSSPTVWRSVLWRTPEGGQRQLIAAEAPIGGPLGVATIPNYYAEVPALSPGGEVTFAARGPANAASTNPIGIAILSDDEVSIQAITGEAAPGVQGLTLTSVSLGNSAGEGAISVHAQLSDGRRGLWLLGSEGLEPRLIAGDPVPGGDTGEVIDTFFYQSVVNSQGVVAAYGGTRIGTSSSVTGVWISDSSGYRLVAKQGDPAPGSNGLFNGFIRSEPVLNSRGQIAFLGSVGSSPMFSGIWATNTQGELVKVVKAGDPVEVAPGDVRTVQSLQLATRSGSDDGRPSPFNDIGQLVYTATFSDSTSAVLLSEAVAQLDADYNADGAVDQADYDVWRGAYGSGLAAADGNGDGLVDAADYTLWRDQLGARLFTFQVGSAVPEPAAAALALLATAGWLSSPRRRG